MVKAKEQAKATSAQVPKAQAVGRRKSSVARIWLRRGAGKISVNGLDFERYFDTEMTRIEASRPFRVVPIMSNYDVQVNVYGGGKESQAGAVKLGISRAFVQLDDAIRPVLRKHGLLTVDARQKERKKYGQRGARRKFQFVKR